METKEKGGVIMEDILAKLKELIQKLVDFVKGLLAKLNIGGEEGETAA